MEFTFLGTSAGSPTRVRNVTGLALRHGGLRNWYLIDCGEGTQHQLLRTSCTLHRLRAIFITHVHGDHTYGLPGLLSTASMAGREEALSIIAPPGVRTFVETTLQATDSKLKFPLHFFNSEEAGQVWADDAFAVSTVALSHRVPCRAFVFTEKNLPRALLTEKLQADGIAASAHWGELQRGRDVQLEDGRVLRSQDYVSITQTPRRVVVAGDNDDPPLLAEACRDAHLLIHEATYTQEVSDRVGPAPQHSSAAQVARFAESVGLPNLVLTHFSARYQFNGRGGHHIDEIAEEARQYYSGTLHLARDLDSYSLDRNGALTPVLTPSTADTGAAP